MIMRKKLSLLSLLMLLTSLIAAQNSPNITRVLEYRPAPGQHINRIYPTPAMSDTPENALKFAENSLVDNKSILGLGGFGGYVIVGFDHPIVNVKDEYDFKGLGNAYTNSCEPGIVMVCQDLNKNGRPDADEPWYELAGSEYNNAATIHNYEITYYRPEPDGLKSNIRWTDNQGKEGVITHIPFATQSTMYPLWITDNTLKFKGTKLANTVVEASGFYQLPGFNWGYIDNQSNAETIDKNGFKIDWAVDENGNPVHLNTIDFIKVYTAQLQEAGSLGETSTDFAGIIDLHPDAVAETPVENIYFQDIKFSNPFREHINLHLPKNGKIMLYDVSGQCLISQPVSEGDNRIETGKISSGIFILLVAIDGETYTYKLIKN